METNQQTQKQKRINKPLHDWRHMRLRSPPTTIYELVKATRIIFHEVEIVVETEPPPLLTFTTVAFSVAIFNRNFERFQDSIKRNFERFKNLSNKPNRISF